MREEERGEEEGGKREIREGSEGGREGEGGGREEGD